MPGEKEPRGGLNETQAKAMADAIAVLKAEGAEIVDPADIPSVVDPDPKNNFLAWGTCSGPDDVRGKDANCSIGAEVRDEARLQRLAGHRSAPRRR